MVAANTTPSSSVTAFTGVVLNAATQVDLKLERLVRDVADSAERATDLGLAQLCLDDTNAVKVANAAAIVKMQTTVAMSDHEKEKLKAKVRNNDGWYKSKLRKERRRTDRLEGLVEILLEQQTMPATEESRALFTKKREQFEKAHKAKWARSDAEVYPSGQAMHGPYSSDMDSD
ncbi:hypothetical protein N0V85_003352 [Neurospora sp. IMI 360204]|nr:hypothetical protein N0V85_003352 [Neurospora sp. IMI 360204]